MNILHTFKSKFLSEKSMILTIYFLMIFGLLLGGMLSFLGLFGAYLAKFKSDSESKGHEHLKYIIKTFWICTLLVVIGFFLTPVHGVGIFLIVASSIWALYRYIAGAFKANQGLVFR